MIYDGILIEDWQCRAGAFEPDCVRVFPLREHAEHHIFSADTRGHYWELKERKVRALGFTFSVWVFMAWDVSDEEGRPTIQGSTTDLCYSPEDVLDMFEEDDDE